MATPTVRLNVSAARGESYADILRRTGLFGVLPTDDDETAIGKLNADTQALLDATEQVRDQAADLALPENIFIADTVADATTAAEAAVSVGTTFKAIGTTEGLAEVRERTSGGSDLLYQELTKAALESSGGAGLAGFSHAAAYDPGTVGDHLKRFVCITDPPFNAVGDGVADDGAAIQAAIDSFEQLSFDLNVAPGTLYFPPGVYRYTVSPTVPSAYYNRLNLIGYGAVLKPEGAIAGLTISQTHFVTVEGFVIDVMNNNDVTEGILVAGQCSWTRFRNVAVIGNTTNANFACARLRQIDPNNGDTANFHTTFENFVCRKNAHADPGNLPVGIDLIGAQNATLILNSSINNNDVGVLLRDASAPAGIPNSVVVDNTAFEATTTAIRVTSATPSHNIAGLRITNCRGETSTNFLLLDGITAQPSVPPFLAGNSIVSSVLNYINNPNSLYVTSFDSVVTPSNIQPQAIGFNTWRFRAVGPSQHAARFQPSGNGFGVELWNGAGIASEWRQRAGGGAELTGGAAGKLGLIGVEAISGSSVTGKNLRGSIAFSAATTATVTFSVEEPDASYGIYLDVPSNNKYWVTGKSTGGFTINCDAANSNIVRWLLVR